LTESARAKEILGDWTRFEKLFWKIAPLPPANLAPAAPVAENANGALTPAAPPASGEPAKT
jgi:glutamate synthase domain-containing protein 3